MKSRAIGCTFLFGILWCGFIAFSDVVIARDVVFVLRASFFPQAAGTVVTSSIKTNSDSESGESYSPQITSRYFAEGREITALAKTNSTGFEHSQPPAQSVVARYPAGAPITIYYEPGAPERSTYDPGLKAGHLQVALFLIPFHVVGLFLLSPLIPRLRRGWSEPRFETGDNLQMIVRLPALSPVIVGLGALGLAAFFCVFISVLFHPLNMQKIGVVWVIVLALAGWAFLFQRRRISDGQYELVIDAAAKTILLPPIDERTARTSLRFEEIRAVTVQTLPKDFTRKTRWGVTVTHEDSSPQFELKLVGANEFTHLVSRSANEDLLRAIAAKLSATFGWSLGDPARG